MKIVFINRYFYPDQSATSQMTTDLAIALAEAGFVVHVICSRQRYAEATAAALPANDSFEGVHIHRVWTTRAGHRSLFGRAVDYLSFFVSATLLALRLVVRDDTLIAETDPPLLSVQAMAVAGLKRARLINWLQDLFPEVASELGANPLPRPVDRALRALRNLSLRRACVNVVLGTRMFERVRALDVPKDKIQIIANWGERAPSHPRTVGAAARRLQLGLTDRFVVAYSGNLGRAHEFQTVLDAAVALQRNTSIVFLMIGGGIGMAHLKREVGLRSLDNFVFLPYQPRETLIDSLAAADVHWVSLRPALEGLIVPSKFYGILAAARPVIFIGDPDGELAREIRAVGCGAALPTGQSDEFVRLIEAWSRDPALCERMGRTGYVEYRARYSAERAFAQWVALLKPARDERGA